MAVQLLMAGLALGSTVYSAKRQRDANEYDQRVLHNQAVRVANRGVEEENRLREDTEQLKARQRVTAAANNIDINSGSAGLLQEGAGRIGEIDAMTIRRNFSDRVNAIREQAVIRDFQSDTAVTKTLIGGATQAAGHWYQQGAK